MQVWTIFRLLKWPIDLWSNEQRLDPIPNHGDAALSFRQRFTSGKMLKEGVSRPADYRDPLAEIIRTRFKTRKEFCEKVNIGEDILCHVLAHRKHFSMESLLAITKTLSYDIKLEPAFTASDK